MNIVIRALKKIKKIIQNTRDRVLSILYAESMKKHVLEDVILIESSDKDSFEDGLILFANELFSNIRFSNYRIYIVHFGKKKDMPLKLPGRARSVRYGSFLYYRLLATAKYLFCDGSFPGLFCKRPEQVYTFVPRVEELSKLASERSDYRNEFENVRSSILSSDYLVFSGPYPENDICDLYMINDLYSGALLYTASGRSVQAYENAGSQNDKDRISDILNIITSDNNSCITTGNTGSDRRPKVLAFAEGLQPDRIADLLKEKYDDPDLEKNRYFVCAESGYEKLFENEVLQANNTGAFKIRYDTPATLSERRGLRMFLKGTAASERYFGTCSDYFIRMRRMNFGNTVFDDLCILGRFSEPACSMFACSGLPLAVCLTGRAQYNRRYIKKWKGYFEFLESRGAVIEDEETDSGVFAPGNIDFVIPYVDGADPEWIEKKNKYLDPSEKVDARDIRYRDWDNLRYWFRGVEKYAPWVRKVYLITDDQVPEWINRECSKLVVINHEDYIPTAYLPTFSANPIELNLHRIKGLSEQFVFFNDDVFLTAAVRPEDFFRDGLPCDFAEESPAYVWDPVFARILTNNIMLLNKHYGRKDVYKKLWKKLYSPVFPKGMKQNLMLRLAVKNDAFFGFDNRHVSSAFLRSSLEAVWGSDFEILDSTSRRKFRTGDDVNQYVFTQYQYVNGLFSPYNKEKCTRIFRMTGAAGEAETVSKAITRHKYKQICINEAGIGDIEHARSVINSAFEKTLPKKSVFEK